MAETRADDAVGWVDRHGDGLYRYALLRLRSPELAADVVQETFLEALRSRTSFEGRSSERTWLVGVLKHKIADHFRKAGRQPPTVNGVVLDESEFDARGHWRAPPGSWGGEPSRDLENREFWEVVMGCLAKLPPGLAEAFLLRELEGLDADEVRERLGITDVNLWARLHRARSLLRRCLESRWFDRKSSSAPDARTVKGPPPP